MSRRMWATGLAAVALAVSAGGNCEAGATGGPRRQAQRVEARSTFTLSVEFRGGEVAEFGIVGDGDTDVDVIVYDAGGRRVVQDVGLTDLGLVRWTPPETQVYRIELVNLGNVWNDVRYGHN